MRHPQLRPATLSAVHRSLPISIVLTGMLSLLPTLPGSSQSFTPPPGKGAPSNTVGAGSRPAGAPVCGEGTETQAQLTALAPAQTTGLTASEHPVIWVHLPKTTAKTLEFSLFDHQQEGVYQVNMPISAEAGLVKIPLPSTIPALKVDRPYAWVAALICNPQRRTEDLRVSGRIQRQSLSRALQRQLKTASPEQQIQLYLQSGFWYEALNQLMLLGQAQPTHPKLGSLWSQLLKSAGLEPMLSTPFARQAHR